MRVALVQSNPLVGAIRHNADAVLAAYERAVGAGADLVCATELVLTGYPPEDLLLKPAFLTATADALAGLAAATGAVPLVVGFAEALDSAPADGWRPVTSRPSTAPVIANAAAVLRDGAVAGVYRKQRLPNYGVFDEARYFAAGEEPLVVEVGGVAVAVTVCEDLWGEGGPARAAAAAGAAVVCNLNASPFSRGKHDDRERWASHHARAEQVWVVYVNQVGGQDEVVFDGNSFVMDPAGVVTARGASFAEDLVVADLPAGRDAGAVPAPPAAARREHAPRPAPSDPLAEVYAALVLGTRDYVRKNGFKRVWIGLSGGIDSSLVAAVAADALGAGAVHGVAMPSPHSSPGSLTDAEALATALGIDYRVLPIADAMSAFAATLAGSFAGTAPGVAEENIQSRIRGTILMALSNKFGDMVLATGNKSEYAVGYATLYGDMAGGFAVLKDVPKTLVFALAEWRNQQGTVIPRTVLDKPPSAELRPDQKDTDSLPPYEVLDPILERYVEQDAGVDELAAEGHDEAVVRRIAQLVDRAEYKRRQAPPGVKITARAFGKDRRLPITQAWSG